MSASGTILRLITGWAPAREFHAHDVAAPASSGRRSRRPCSPRGHHLDRMIGSSRTGPAFAHASLKAMEPAILKAISEESTSW
jgi:hypothetical protein